MLESTAKTINHLFDSVHCTLLPKSDPLYSPEDVLIVWKLKSGFVVRLKSDGYLYYSQDRGENAFQQYIHCCREVDDLIHYFD